MTYHKEVADPIDDYEMKLAKEIRAKLRECSVKNPPTLKSIIRVMRADRLVVHNRVHARLKEPQC